MRASELIKYCQLLIGDENGDVHSDERCLMHLNVVLEDISAKSKSIVESLYLPAVAQQSRYGLPEGFLRLEICGWQVGGGRYLPLSPISMEIASWATFNGITGRPRYFDIFGRAAVERVVSTVAEVGAKTGSRLEVGETWVRLLGEHVVGIKRGDRLVNVSDGSSVGRVLEARSVLNAQNVTEQIILYSALEDGTRSVFNVDDEVRILSPGSPRQSLIISPVPTDVGEIGEEALFLFLARKHRAITARDMLEENDDIELDTELLACLRESLLSAMMEADATYSPQDVQAKFIKAQTLYYDAVPDVLKRIRAWKSMWYTRQRIAPNGLGEFRRGLTAQYPIGSAYTSY